MMQQSGNLNSRVIASVAKQSGRYGNEIASAPAEPRNDCKRSSSFVNWISSSLRTARILILSILIFISFSSASPAAASITASLQGLPDSTKFGDPLKLQITVTSPPDGKILLPDWTKALEPFELLSPPDTSQQQIVNGQRQWNLKLNAVCYQAGAQVFKSLTFKWISADGSVIDSAATDVKIVEVQNVIPDSILAVADSTQQPHHLLRPNRQWKLGYSLADFYIYILILFGAAAAYFLIRWYLRKRRSKVVEAVAGPPPEPAHVIALRALDHLRDQQLFQAGRIKDYYSELSEILRRYFELRFDVPAMESTSFQLLRDIEVHLGDKELIASLETLLTDADLAKFAKHQPNANTCQQDLEQAYTLVNQTKPAPKPLLSEEAA
ncbi:MAG: hypothetical protein NTW14_11010 [bacterium]|nr:hypothetical protein [bacterium]